jgi:hypothetical protein
MRLQGPHAPIFGIAYGRLCFDDGLDKMLAPEAESLLFQTWNVAWSIPPGTLGTPVVARLVSNQWSSSVSFKDVAQMLPEEKLGAPPREATCAVRP